MKRYLFLFLCVCLLSGCDNKQPVSHETILPSAIKEVLNQYPNNPSIGIFIKNLDDNQVIARYNPKRSFIPASTTKIITATLALKVLGPNYRFVTSVARSGTIDDGTLNGDILFNFNGDPSFKYKQLVKLVKAIKQKGIKDITGNVIVNTGKFAVAKPGPGFMWDDLNFCFAAPSSAIVIHRNCFRFTMYPSKTLNTLSTIQSKHGFMFTPINNEVKTQLKKPKNCPVDMDVNNQNHYRIYGCIPYRGSPYYFDVAVRNPRYMLQQALLYLFKQNDIVLEGKIVFSKKKYQATIIAKQSSQPLSHLLKHMLKESDNLYANIIFKTVGAAYMDSTANWRNSEKATNKILRKLHFNLENFRMVDGAGISVYNRITPDLLMQILQYNFANAKTGQDFRSALSIAGKDGTLKNFQLSDQHAAFHAKTGNMFAVTSLAGILTTAENKHIAVVIMINGFDTSRNYFKLAHQIIATLN